eukprot:4060439-Pyramimonas_sp.AAC.1
MRSRTSAHSVPGPDLVPRRGAHRSLRQGDAGQPNQTLPLVVALGRVAVLLDRGVRGPWA